MTRTVTPVTRTSYTMMTETIRALELHYPMIQFLIKAIIANTGIKSKVYFYFGPDEYCFKVNDKSVAVASLHCMEDR